MAMLCKNINQLAAVLRSNGDKILDASSKLTLSTNLLYSINESLSDVMRQRKAYSTNFHVVEEGQYDMQFLYDFIQKTVALKVLPDNEALMDGEVVDVRIFRNLKLLEIQRLSLGLIKGLKSLRAQLEYLTCIHSLKALGEVLESCGGDNSQGFMWKELKKAVFSYNSLDSLDSSLEFVPWLHTLDLSHNHIHDAQPLNCLTHLQYVNLSYNQLESVPAFSCQLQARIRVLILSNNFIEDLKELAFLANLSELDLSYNCLLEHSSLRPIAGLAKLQSLNLYGNPLSYHPRHRLCAARYFHFDATSHFVLDNTVLSKAEKQLVGSVRPVVVQLDRSHLDSVCSTGSESTVIPAEQCEKKRESAARRADVSSSSITTVRTEASELSEDENKSEVTNFWTIQENIGMQDSGIVAGRRETSPSECSIGSIG